MQTHVAIATTQGPVFIQKLTPEEVDVMSLVCLDMTSKQLAISRGYADFVKKGSGLIARDFEHPSWRMDISANIDTGESWQLAVYLAHVFHARVQLGDGNPKPNDRVLLATGEVLSTRVTEAVRHVPRKFEMAQEKMRQWREMGVVCSWVVNPANLNDLPDDVEKSGLLNVLDFERDATRTTSDRTTGQQLAHKALLFALFVSAVILAAVTLPDTDLDLKEIPWSDYFSFEFATKPVMPVMVALLVTTNSVPSRCGSQSDAKGRFESNEAAGFKATHLNGVCGITLLHDGLNTEAWLYSLDSGALRELHWQVDPDGWNIPLPMNRSKDRPYMMMLFESAPSAAQLDQLEHKLDKINPGVDQTNQLLEVIHKSGLATDVYFHRLTIR